MMYGVPFPPSPTSLQTAMGSRGSECDISEMPLAGPGQTPEE